MMNALLLLAALGVGPPPASCPTTVEKALSDTQEVGGVFLGAVPVPGAGFDAIYVFSAHGFIVLGAGLGDCMVGPPRVFDQANPDATPTAAPPPPDLPPAPPGRGA